MDRHSFTLALFGLILIFSTAQAYVLYGGALYCNTTCADCEAALNNDSYNTVYLNSSLSSPGASCINNPANFSSKIFDCQGNSITGNGNGHGIYLDSRTNDTIRNCSIEAFSNTLVLYHVSNSTFSNLTLFNTSSGDCVYFYNITNTVLANSTIYNCLHEGMSLDYSSNNTIINNIVHHAVQQGLEATFSDWNLITRNTFYNSSEAIDFHIFGPNTHNTVSYNNISDCLKGLALYPTEFGTSQYNLFANNTISTRNRINDIYPELDPWAGQDVFIEASDIGLCNNIFQNNTGTGGLPIYFSNSAVSWSDFGASQIILCDADNSVLRNITVRSGDNADGVFIYYSDNVSISDTSSIGNLYGFLFHNSENNALVNSIAYDNVFTDLQFGQSYLIFDPRYCNNIVQNLTSSGGRQIYFTNETVAWSDMDLAEVILCNADNSVLTNITVRGSDSLKNNGFMMYLSDNVTVSSSFSISNYYGFDMWNSNHLTFANNTAYEPYSHGFASIEVNDSVFYNNTAYSCLIGLEDEWGDNNTYTSNTAYNNTYSGFEMWSPTNSRLANNLAYGNALNGFYIFFSSNVTLTNNTAYGNGFDFTDTFDWMQYYPEMYTYAGFGIILSPGITMQDNTAYGNSHYGIVANLSGEFNSTNDRVYDNGVADVYVGTDSTPVNTSFAGLVIDSDSGRHSDYANLTITDELDADTAYTIGWAERPTAFPTGLISFEDKFIDITATAGTTSIDSVIWTWAESETTHYNESSFSLWEYSPGTWADTNATLDTDTNQLSLSDLVPASTYAILATALDEEDDDSEPRPEPECTYSSDCGLCEICSAGECRPGGDCAADSDCGGNGYTCSNYGCVAPECTGDSDCGGNGYTCSGYSCTAPECVSDTNCPTGQVCTSYSCVPAAVPECTTDSQCGADEYCSDSACTGITCDCGTIANHTCTHYECCTNYDCADDHSCKNHVCTGDSTKPPVTSPGTTGNVSGNASAGGNTSVPGDDGPGKPGEVPKDGNGSVVGKNPPSAGEEMWKFVAEVGGNTGVRISFVILLVVAIATVFYLRARNTATK